MNPASDIEHWEDRGYRFWNNEGERKGMASWDENLEMDRTLANGIDACLEALETGQAQAAADILRVMKTHVSANNEKVKESRASAPYIYALSKVRARARDKGTRQQHGQSFVEGLLCAANILEKQYRRSG